VPSSLLPCSKPPLRPRPRPSRRRYYSEVNSRLPLFDDQDLADTISAFSTLNALLKQDFLNDFLASVHQKLAGFEARPLANVLYALGRMRTQVPQHWLDDVAQVRRGRGHGWPAGPSTGASWAQGAAGLASAPACAAALPRAALQHRLAASCGS
jgi:hypothetical protein